MRHYDPSPPFHKAIIESGATTARAVYLPTNAMHQEQFDSFISKLGLSSVPEDQLLSKLRSQDVAAIKSASDAVYDAYNPSIRWPFQPVIDGPGGLIPTAPISAWEAGNWTRVPILTGFNTDEGALFVPHSPATNKDFTDFFHTLLPSLSEQDIKVLQTTYPDPVTNLDSPYRETARGVGPQFERLEQAYGQFAYVAPVRQTARYVAADEGKDGGVPVYLYHFAVNSSVVGGADHGDHAGFVTYDKSVRERSDTLGEVAGLMHDYWTSFITR
jgi:acetylcholinesterase